MPANLPPEYFQAEKRYRQAKTIEEKIEALEAMLSIMPRHKGTDRLHAELRAKLARLSEEAEKRPTIGRKGSLLYQVKKEGAGQVALVGLPNVGKSSLLASLTEATPEIADYPFTTQIPIPGMMKFENIQIQLVDLPPITNRGVHSWLANILRNADLLLIMVDLSQEPISQVEATLAELEKMKIKLVGKEEGMVQGMRQKRGLLVGNKSDIGKSGTLISKYTQRFPVILVSAREGKGLEELKKRIYQALDIIRVYTKAPGRQADLEEPVILKKGSTVEDVAESIHKDFRDKLKYALVWGSGKFNGQRVKREHVLEDGDIVELHL